MKDSLLIVDDEQEWLDVLSTIFMRKGMNVHTAISGKCALSLTETEAFDLILCDLAMPELSGIDVLKKLRLDGNQTPLIIMTGVGSIQTAVQSVQFGAYNYITKPFKLPELEALIHEAIAFGRMQRNIRNGKAFSKNGSSMVLGNNKALLDSLQTIEKISDSKVTVLISGETGTGKSMLAKHIHEKSTRSDKPFVTIDCSSLQENILESELFGHIKGSFTGAVSTRRGLLEEADGGTVFLDEIGELSPSMQAKLLSAVQNQIIRPVGGNKTIPIDVRFIAATHRDLKHEVLEGSFREDLYYRLAVITLYLPPLRERRNDLIELVTHFIKKFNAQYGKSVMGVTPSCMKVLLEYPWHGNIRELEHTIERAVLLADGDELMPIHLGFASKLNQDGGADSEPSISLYQARKGVERQSIEQALAQTGGNKTRAAALLGIGRRTLYDKMNEFHIGTGVSDNTSES